ncbi:MAG: SDR family oxidoreductase [Alphaproteobacteria bacterium]|jgi:NAD(P)-dependent dehydrogenase (short-subunit alcohol dehydrogenase family)
MSTKSPFDITGKTAIVTGSTKGIGRAIAVALAEAGAKVAVSSRDAGRVAETAQSLTESGHKVIGIPCNVGRKQELQNLVDQTKAQLGPIDILICNAAINPYYGPAMEIPDDVFAKVMHTNIQAQLWLTQMVVPDMKAQKDGAIILISSIGGLRGSDVIGAYNISKAADIQLAKNLAVELGPDNIRVNAIAPGLVKTDFARALWENPEFAEPRIAATPLRRLGEPEDIAGAAVFLASNAGRWTTGQTIVIDGGATVPV